MVSDADILQHGVSAHQSEPGNSMVEADGFQKDISLLVRGG